MNSRTSLLILIGLLCPALAQAQQPATSTSPSTAPSAGSAPAASATATSTSTSTSSATPAATPPPPPGPSRFAGSTFGWNHTASTTLVGVGRDNIGAEGDYYSWFFTLSPSFFVYRDKVHQVRLSASPTLGVEMTNSDSTTTEREPQLLDIPVRLTYVANVYKSAAPGAAPVAPGKGGAAAARDPTLAGGGRFRTWGIVSGGVNLPTAPTSYNQGRYLTTVATLGVRQQVELLGNDAAGLNNITFTLSESWWHLFSRASTPTNEDLQIARQDNAGRTFASDQLTGRALVPNTLIHSLSFFIPVVGDLQLSSAFQLMSMFPYTFEGSDCEVQVSTGCVKAGRLQNRAEYRTLTTFDVNLAYQVSPELLVDIGYQNAFVSQLGEDGQRRNFFYSPGATFYADIIVTLDQLYKRVSSPPKPSTQVGRRGR